MKLHTFKTSTNKKVNSERWADVSWSVLRSARRRKSLSDQTVCHLCRCVRLAVCSSGHTVDSMQSCRDVCDLPLSTLPPSLTPSLTLSVYLPLSMRRLQDEPYASTWIQRKSFWECVSVRVCVDVFLMYPMMSVFLCVDKSFCSLILPVSCDVVFFSSHLFSKHLYLCVCVFCRLCFCFVCFIFSDPIMRPSNEFELKTRLCLFSSVSLNCDVN